MDTFELLPSLAQGELGETSAPELVAAVFRSRASGTLWLETPKGVEMRIFFRAGEMCGAGFVEGFHTLAHVLLANDWVNALDIETSREEAVATKRRHGEVLVSRGLLTAAQLQSALRAQHTTNLNRVLTMTEGKYDWRGWEPPPPWAREVQVDPVACLVYALEQEQHSARRTKIIQWLGASSTRLSVDWQDLQGRIRLDPVDRRAATLLALPRKPSEFVRASKLSKVRAEALLAALLLAGAAEPAAEGAGSVVQTVAEPEPPTVDPLPDDAPENILEEQLPEPELLDDEGRGQKKAAPRPRKALVDEDEALARLDSLSLSTGEEGSSPVQQEEELEIDHERLGRAQKAGAGPDTSPQPKSSAAGSDEQASRELRKKMLARGLRNLGAPPVQPRDGEAAEEPSRIGAPPAEEPPLDTGALSAEDRLFAEEVRVRVARAPKQSAYVRLGLAPGATTEQIKTAYLQAAKRFHPDRSSAPGLAGLKADLEKLFSLLKDAYEAIATPEARAKNQKQPERSSKSSSRGEEAYTALKMGEVLLKKRDFAAALDKLRRAAELEPSGDTLAALAWGLVRDPKCTAQGKDEAASLINRALRANGVTARTYYVAGVLWRTRDPDAAADAFRKAMQIDPSHSDAALELRLIEQRRGKQKEGGVLSGIFGKRKG